MSQRETRPRICIIGLGLIGGSLGLAIRAAKAKDIEVVGYDREPTNEERARRLGAIDHGVRDLADGVSGASIVILATPIQAMREVLIEIAPLLPAGSIVTDVASTKTPVLRWAEEHLPAGVSFVGGHPMAGKETQGIANAEAGLFRDKVYCLCPATEATEASIGVVQSLVRLVGARSLFIDPQEHDQYVAAVSHLPLMLSVALFEMLCESTGWQEIALLAASGFRDTTRLASGDAQMSYDIAVTNREALLGWLDRYLAQLASLRQAIADADPQLLERFARIKLKRDTFIESPAGRPDIRAAGVPAEGELEQSLIALLAGRSAAERLTRNPREQRS